MARVDAEPSPPFGPIWGADAPPLIAYRCQAPPSPEGMCARAFEITAGDDTIPDDQIRPT